LLRAPTNQIHVAHLTNTVAGRRQFLSLRGAQIVAPAAQPFSKNGGEDVAAGDLARLLCRVVVTAFGGRDALIELLARGLASASRWLIA
jgi:hypothetical protein